MFFICYAGLIARIQTNWNSIENLRLFFYQTVPSLKNILENTEYVKYRYDIVGGYDEYVNIIR